MLWGDEMSIKGHNLPVVNVNEFQGLLCGMEAAVWFTVLYRLCFPGGSAGKESAYEAEALGSIPGLGRSPGEGNGNLLQYACPENSMDRQ